jgi:hypothetical protein
MSERIPTRSKSSNDDGDGSGLCTGYVVSTKPCKLMSLLVKLDETAPAAGWVHLAQAAAVPANGTVPTYPSVPLAPGQFASVEVGAHGIDFDALSVSFSTTHPLQTLGGKYLQVYAVLLG